MRGSFFVIFLCSTYINFPIIYYPQESATIAASFGVSTLCCYIATNVRLITVTTTLVVNGICNIYIGKWFSLLFHKIVQNDGTCITLWGSLNVV